MSQSPDVVIADLRAQLAAEKSRADSADRIKSAEKLILIQEIEAHVRTKAENAILRKIVSDVVASLGTGASCSVQASIEFMQVVPSEVSRVMDRLRDEARRARAHASSE